MYAQEKPPYIRKKRFSNGVNEGRGSGHGSEYRPWLTVSRSPLSGSSSPHFGHKSKRTHHLLSDLELAVFLLLEWLPEVTDIREQFPLDRTLTKQLARDAGIRHPAQQGVEHFMSTDFLVDTTDDSEPKYALQVKYSNALDDERTVEKLELERRFWLEKGIPWYLVTEQQIPKAVLANVEWLYPAGRRDDEAELPLEQIEFYQHHFSEAGNTKIIEVCKKLDMAYTTLSQVSRWAKSECFWPSAISILIFLRQLES